MGMVYASVYEWMKNLPNYPSAKCGACGSLDLAYLRHDSNICSWFYKCIECGQVHQEIDFRRKRHIVDFHDGFIDAIEDEKHGYDECPLCHGVIFRIGWIQDDAMNLYTCLGCNQIFTEKLKRVSMPAKKKEGMAL